MSRRNMDWKFVSKEDSTDAYQSARRQIADAPPPPNRGRYRSGPSRARNQQTRSDMYRRKASNITENDLSQELKNKLFPGVKDGQSAVERLEAYNTERAITLTVTTRAIGMSTFHIFSCIFEYNNVPARGNIYQLYRVALAAFEAKIVVVNRDVRQIQDTLDDYQRSEMNNDMIIAAKAIAVLPDQLSSVINAVGHVRISEKIYVPKIGRINFDRANRFVPQVEQVSLTNLRRTVVALADPATPIIYRQQFYNNNAIPGCRWRGHPQDPILINPDEIMPNVYGVVQLEDDMEDIRAKLNFMNKKAPKYFTSAINFDPAGDKAMLVCNQQNGMRLPDRQQQTDEEYFRSRVEGDIEEYSNIERLTTKEQLEGNLCLLGEIPTTAQLRYPVYIQRDHRVCCETSALRYKSARNIKYT